MAIDLLALDRHGSAAINALPTSMMYNGTLVNCSFRTTRTNIAAIDGGTVTMIGGSVFVSKSVCLSAFSGIPKPETQCSIRQADGSFLSFFIEDVLGAEDATLTEVSLVLGPTNK